MYFRNEINFELIRTSGFSSAFCICGGGVGECVLILQVSGDCHQGLWGIIRSYSSFEMGIWPDFFSWQFWLWYIWLFIWHLKRKWLTSLERYKGVSLSHDFYQTLVPCILWVLSLGCTHWLSPVYFSLRLQDLIRTLESGLLSGGIKEGGSQHLLRISVLGLHPYYLM